MTTITLSYRAVQNKITSVNLSRINWKLVYFFGILFSLLLLVFYVFLINELTKGTYLIRNYNKEVNSLLGENRILETKFANSGFLGDIQVKVKGLSLEKTTDVKYVQILDSLLVKAR